MSSFMLKQRQERLEMPLFAISRMSGVPEQTVTLILSDPTFSDIDGRRAVEKVLGYDEETHDFVSVDDMIEARVQMKARYVAKLVQGTQGLEAGAVGAIGYKRIIDVAARTLRGKIWKLWDED